MTLELDRIHKIDYLEGLRALPDHSVDLILTDPPYNLTECDWEFAIDFKSMWQEFKRVLKENGVVIITGTQPFTTQVINSNPEWFRYIWYWQKEQGTGFAIANKQPLKLLEDCVVFYKKFPTYHPIKKRLAKPYYRKMLDNTKSKSSRMTSQTYICKKIFYEYETPTNVIYCPRDKPHNSAPSMVKNEGHPTQKPLELFKFFIATYTDPDALVLDVFIGSGTTAVAAKQLGRHFVGFDISDEYIAFANKRLAQEVLSEYAGGD